MEQQDIECPFCGYKTDNEYQIMMHMETLHAEGKSPFVTNDDDASMAAMISLADEDIQYASCPVEGCGEGILLTELDSHIEMHSIEQGDNGSETESENEPDAKKPRLKKDVSTAFATKLSNALRNLDDSDKSSSVGTAANQQTKAKAEWKNLLRMPESSSSANHMSPNNPQVASHGSHLRRLGKSELGPHANEKQMPSWLVRTLEKDGMLESVNRVGEDGKPYKVRTSINHSVGVLPVVGRLLDQDKSTSFAYLCHPAVKHCSKLRGEGGFCGYRNIQTLCSYIVEVQSQGWKELNNKIPSIFEIQEFIEHAWDLGINAQGRIETGGIRGTRKYIGTTDAQATFCSLDISCDAQALKAKKKGEGPPAYKMLFDAVSGYFIGGCTDFDSKVRRTALPPLYFQHPGHSMTIVGFEVKKDGTKNLICFDPMFHEAANVMRLVDNKNFKQKAPADMLKAYRRGKGYLQRYNEFEFLKLSPPESKKGNVRHGTWERAPGSESSQ